MMFMHTCAMKGLKGFSPEWKTLFYTSRLYCISVHVVLYTTVILHTVTYCYLTHCYITYQSILFHASHSYYIQLCIVLYSTVILHIGLYCFTPLFYTPLLKYCITYRFVLFHTPRSVLFIHHR